MFVGGGLAMSVHVHMAALNVDSVEEGMVGAHFFRVAEAVRLCIGGSGRVSVEVLLWTPKFCT